jgi:cellulose synthase/poly-beta-1,6-N-acetylglucosamine synthase-like glycosyltransferase
MSSSAGPGLSVLIITLNEERLLERVLESVRWADEIVIVDSGSTDRTEEIARRFTNRFHVRAYVGEGEQRRRSLELSTGEWVLYIDGDEIVSPQLAASIRRAVATPGPIAGFRVRLHTWFLGRWFGSRGWRREWKVRLFRRDRGHFSPVEVHSGSVVDGPIGTLQGALLHVPYRDLAHMVEKMNSYSTRMAAELWQKGRRSSPGAALVRGLSRFLRDYVAGGDFLYGRAGLVRATVIGYYTFLKYAKLWEAGRSAPPAEALLVTETTPMDP